MLPLCSKMCVARAHRIAAIETGGCPHAAIREDISANLMACENLTARHQADIVLVESGGGGLSLVFRCRFASIVQGYVRKHPGGEGEY